ncbi:MAG: ATP-binding cassette domain-containing protein, partial [Planctomycetes bacterium]|nr:ATP-binding cassette domain-containing protein [Planctomycetota bacterium]
MKILTTFLPPSAGTAKVAGFDVAERPADVCARVGYLPESMPIYPEMRVGEYLRHRAILKGLRGRSVKERIDVVIGECSLGAVRRKVLGALSKGYRQRVGLADAMLADPPVLILDEPTSGLDPRQVAEVRHLIVGLRGRRTILLSSHILGEVEQVCDRVIIIAQGEIRVDSTREQWTAELRSATRLQLVLERRPDEAVERLRSIPGVEEVSLDGDTIRIRSDRDVRRAVADLVAKSRWPLLELHRDTPSLESLFLQATARSDSESAGEPGGRVA